jgi:hypothetical protein
MASPPGARFIRQLYETVMGRVAKLPPDSHLLTRRKWRVMMMSFEDCPGPPGAVKRP